ncbi:hypothetical protein [Streptomyces mutabilis]|uniref:Uncharacterized protein n=1 Tax=Streptomyces mutabilis TaxID=67332 RepID=A0A086MRE4_9ACTN|nr:hypothetical protein [Streptomyces mutabilis]KFG71462.1 hypothetical protein FM21_34975 [Streptomyces mutabilis]
MRRDPLEGVDRSAVELSEPGLDVLPELVEEASSLAEPARFLGFFGFGHPTLDLRACEVPLAHRAFS